MGLLQARGAGWSCGGSICAAGRGVRLYVPRPGSVTPLEDELREERWGPGLGCQLLFGVGKTAPVPRSSEAGCVMAPQAEAPGRPGARSLVGLAAHVDGRVPALPLFRSPRAGASAASSERPRLLNQLSGLAGTAGAQSRVPCARSCQKRGSRISRSVQWVQPSRAIVALSELLCQILKVKRFCSCLWTMCHLHSLPQNQAVRAVSPRFQKHPVRLSRGPLTRGAGSGDVPPAPGATANPLGLVTKYLGKRDYNKTFSS